MIIRQEKKKDYYEVEKLIRDSFWNVYQEGCDEHLIVHKLRNDECYVQELSYIIEEDNKIVAAIFYAYGTLTTDNLKKEKIIFFGPIGVHPSYQNKGYGSKLITYTLEKAKEKGYNFVLITGNPAYYHRFGFENASKYHIHLEGMDKNDPADFFMIKILNESNINQGVYSHPSIYEVDKNELAIFENNFMVK